MNVDKRDIYHQLNEVINNNSLPNGSKWSYVSSEEPYLVFPKGPARASAFQKYLVEQAENALVVQIVQNDGAQIGYVVLNSLGDYFVPDPKFRKKLGIEADFGIVETDKFLTEADQLVQHIRRFRS